MSANTEKCSDKDKSYCEYNEFRRLRYFHGMLLDDKDFRAEQQYHAGKRRFLNRMLHGSGVVCGLELKGEKDKRWIRVTPGLAFDCAGNEIWVDKEQKIDLPSLLPPKNKKSNVEGCTETENGKPKAYCIGIRYQESPTSPVSVYLPSGSCEERTCENSQWKEGYCIEIVDCCVEKEATGLIKAWCQCGDQPYPENGKFKDLCGKCGGATSGNTYDAAAPSADKPTCKCMTMEEFCEESVPCGECCAGDQPCVVILGQLTVDENCALQTLCMNECRRYVLTGRLVQTLLARVFGGAEEYFQMKVNDKREKLPKNGFKEFIYNPIKALCWWLPNKMDKGTLEWLGCDKKEDVEQPRPISPEVDNAIRQFETRMAERMEKRMAEQVQLSLKPITDRLDLIEKPGALEVPSTAAKPQQPKPPKKPGT